MAACTACGQENPGVAKFCLECGAALGRVAAPAGEERKVVTVLFCDLVGFTAASESADPEDVRARIQPYHRRLRTEIERFGGTVEKFIGDAVMAVFGAPVAHEDDAERAVRAGLRILDAIEDLNEDDPSLELRVRIGINTGEAVVALEARPEHGEGIVTGDVVNTASRLQSAAPVGGIAIGELTHRQTSEIFSFEELEPVSVKGKVQPVPIWRPLSARSRFGTDLTRNHTTPLVGRELEQTLLRGTFERSLRDAVQLVTVVGEPGVGKSRLVSELFGYVDDRPELVTWRQGRCLPYGEGISFWALGEIVKAECGILESDSSEQAAAKLDEALRSVPEEREWLRERLAPLVGLEAAPAAQEETFTAWRRFLESLAATGPAVLVFEDLHWADDALLGFLEHLLEWSEGVPLLVLCTARPELYERQVAWAAGTRNSTRIILGPLSNDETAQLVSALLDAAVLPAEVQELVLERAGGNPLYAEEFVRMLRDRQLLVRKGRTLALRAGVEIPFPESVQALIAARLDTLTIERKALLRDASVIGKVFWAGAVSSMGAADERAVREDLHELSRKELVRPARSSSMAGEAEYAFWHLVVRDVCYAQIPRADRAARHRRAGDWIQQQAGERPDDLADVIAYHYVQALELDRAAGRIPDEELEEASRRFLLLAAGRALALDVGRAESSYAQALALSPADHSERAAILTGWAGAAQQIGRLSEAAAALEEAVALYRGRGDNLAAGRAMNGLSSILWQMADPRCEQVEAESVSLLEQEDPGPDLVDAYAQRAGLRFVQSANQEALAAAERALALARELAIEEPARALGFRGAVRCNLGDAGGLDEMRRALELSIERGSGREAAVLHNNLSDALLPFEGPAPALEAFRAGIEFCERRGITEFAHGIASSSLHSLHELGRWDEALSLAASLAEGAEEGGAAIELLEVRVLQARVLTQRGEAERAQAWSDRMVRTARETVSAQMIATTFAAVALTESCLGEEQRAAALLTELEATPNIRESFHYAARLAEMVRTALACGEPDLARRLASGLEPSTPLHGHALCHVDGALAEAAGDLERAASLYRAASEDWRTFGHVVERARALLGLGRCLIAEGRPGAEQALAEARATFADLGARPALTEADALLVRALALTS